MLPTAREQLKYTIGTSYKSLEASPQVCGKMWMHEWLWNACTSTGQMGFTNFWKILGWRSVYMSPLRRNLVLGVFRDVESNGDTALTIFQGGYAVPGQPTNFQNKRQVFRTETSLQHWPQLSGSYSVA